MTHLDKFLSDLTSGGPLCEKCHRPFESSRYWQRFCSATCRTEYNNRRVTGRNPIDPIKPNLEDLA